MPSYADVVELNVGNGCVEAGFALFGAGRTNALTSNNVATGINATIVVQGAPTPLRMAEGVHRHEVQAAQMICGAAGAAGAACAGQGAGRKPPAAIIAERRAIEAEIAEGLGRPEEMPA